MQCFTRLIAGLMSLSVAAIALPSVAAGKNLIQNGSFDSGPKPGYFATFAKGSRGIPGWVVTYGTVDLIGPTFHDVEGHGWSIDVDGTPGPGGIAQTFATTPGTKYTVTFYLAGNPECAPRYKMLAVTVDGISKRYGFDSAGKNDAHMGWTLKMFVFTAHASRSTLAFTSLDPKGSNCGPAIDRVSVTR